jgi:hypothetical protein
VFQPYGYFRHKTAFTCSEGLYEFTCIPFGFKNTTSAYQSLMDGIFKGEIGKSVLVYIDDIIVMSKTFDEHLAHIRETFSRLKDSLLRLFPQ